MRTIGHSNRVGATGTVLVILSVISFIFPFSLFSSVSFCVAYYSFLLFFFTSLTLRYHRVSFLLSLFFFLFSFFSFLFAPFPFSSSTLCVCFLV